MIYIMSGYFKDDQKMFEENLHPSEQVEKAVTYFDKRKNRHEHQILSNSPYVVEGLKYSAQKNGIFSADLITFMFLEKDGRINKVELDYILESFTAPIKILL